MYKYIQNKIIINQCKIFEEIYVHNQGTFVRKQQMYRGGIFLFMFKYLMLCNFWSSIGLVIKKFYIFILKEQIPRQ